MPLCISELRLIPRCLSQLNETISVVVCNTEPVIRMHPLAVVDGTKVCKRNIGKLTYFRRNQTHRNQDQRTLRNGKSKFTKFCSFLMKSFPGKSSKRILCKIQEITYSTYSQEYKIFVKSACSKSVIKWLVVQFVGRFNVNLLTKKIILLIVYFWLFKLTNCGVEVSQW